MIRIFKKAQNSAKASKFYVFESLNWLINNVLSCKNFDLFLINRRIKKLNFTMLKARPILAFYIKKRIL